MLPRFAAAVWSTTTRLRSPGRSARVNTAAVKGTKVMRATSLVMSMEEKKLSSTSASPRRRTLRALPQRRSAMRENSPARVSPATTVMRQYSRARVRRSG